MTVCYTQTFSTPFFSHETNYAIPISLQKTPLRPSIKKARTQKTPQLSLLKEKKGTFN